MIYGIVYIYGIVPPFSDPEIPIDHIQTFYSQPDMILKLLTRTQ